MGYLEMLGVALVVNSIHVLIYGEPWMITIS
jgi:hypothetical protein